MPQGLNFRVSVLSQENFFKVINNQISKINRESIHVSETVRVKLRLGFSKPFKLTSNLQIALVSF